MFLGGVQETMKITAITLTGDRPLAFSLCRKWMVSQTRQPDQWIVVDDGVWPMYPPMFCEYIRRERQPSDPKHTLVLNMIEAVKKVTGDAVVVMEDDEYYSPRYIEEMARRLDHYEIVGIGRSKYYYVPTGGYIRHDNLGHASLAQTAFRSSFMYEFRSILNGDSFLDVRLWTIVNGPRASLCDARNRSERERRTKDGRGIIFDDGEENCLYLGIKGMPGRAGIGSGHKPQAYGKHDKDRSILKKWIGVEAATVYMQLQGDARP